MIALPHDEDSTYVYIPRSLNQEYLEKVLARSLGKDATILSCKTTNLCASMPERVSNSGSTILLLTLELRSGLPLHIVAKILCPDILSTSIWSRGDPDFEARKLEIAWTRWWGQQPVNWVPKVYDTHCHVKGREFWVLQEYFPQVGWPGWGGRFDDDGDDVHTDSEYLRALFRQVAVFHAYSSTRIQELLALFPKPWHPQEIPDAIDGLLADSKRLEAIGLAEEEQHVLALCRDAVLRRPDWVDRSEVACVTVDWKLDNFGIRNSDEHHELIMFDYGTTHLAPAESDLELLPMGKYRPTAETIRQLLSHYAQVYSRETGRSIDSDTLMLRIPWIRLCKTLVGVTNWDPEHPPAGDFARMIVGLCQRTLKELVLS